MRLRKVNVSGFKSFVDPTTIEFPSDLIGIVGPNGCGKSNVIDAVRWVMGESSARHLRGGSMADVIFNGSNTRKPVGRAQVELVFDNTDGRLGDRFAAYSEVSVKRLVGREGTSQYTLNGTRCRRRDITDLFLGTGLGPRSYAVIEQGMISRLIDAKPEELRDYLEEVAGISRYKERRRETETRIRHTREHLERLRDVREELGKQLQRLDRQAKQAERYKVLKTEERELEAQLLALRWRSLGQEVATRGSEVGQALTAVEAETARMRAADTDLERNRVAERDAIESANSAYRTMLEASSAVARTEAGILANKQRTTQLEEGVAREQSTLDQAQARLGFDEQQLADLEENLRDGEPRLEQLEDTMGQSREHYAEQERRMHDWQARWQELANQAQEPSNTANAERARIDALEERLQQLGERRTRLVGERDTLDLVTLDRLVGEANDRQVIAKVAVSEANDGLFDARERVQKLRDDAKQLSLALHEQRAKQQQLQGAHASLHAIQQDALGSSDKAVKTWLEQNGLTAKPRLAQALQVASGWEQATEAVLADALEMVVTDGDAGRFSDALLTLTSDSIGLVSGAVSPHASAPASPADVNGTRLLELTRGPDVVAELLHGVRVATDVHAALAMRAQLADGESIVTREGLRVGKHWLRASANARGDGVLARMQQLRELADELDQCKTVLAELEQAVERAASDLRGTERALSEQQQKVNEQHRKFVAADSEFKTRTRDLEQARSRNSNLDREQAEVDERRQTSEAELGGARRRLGEASELLQEIEAARQQSNESLDETRQQLEQARDTWQRIRDEGYQLGLKVEGWRTRIKALQDSRGRYQEETARLQMRVEELRAERYALIEPMQIAQADLQAHILEHQSAELALAQARSHSQGIEAKLRELAQERSQADSATEKARETLNAKRLSEQETSVRRKTVLEQIAETDKAPEEWVESLPQEATELAWGAQLEEMARRISRLGAINLAAIEEHAEHNERKEYLDAQHADLEEALDTLEAAIKRIDKETRSRFKDTFEKVNTGLSERFPKLFGGGQAYLQLTSEDVLEAGVTIMAQPPGKRNSSVQLLSGGEKALTAVALVFAMFDLNPAPFCLLDEVDAPLDEANVARFSELVREMSEHVQMLVVTHNKVTMEIMHQLVGVTMQEPGVSRLVTVDLNDAVTMVEA